MLLYGRCTLGYKQGSGRCRNTETTSLHLWVDSKGHVEMMNDDFFPYLIELMVIFGVVCILMWVWKKFFFHVTHIWAHACMHSSVRLGLAEETDSLDIKGTTVDHHFRPQTATVNLSEVPSLSGRGQQQTDWVSCEHSVVIKPKEALLKRASDRHCQAWCSTVGWAISGYESHSSHTHTHTLLAQEHWTDLCCAVAGCYLVFRLIQQLTLHTFTPMRVLSRFEKQSGPSAPW